MVSALKHPPKICSNAFRYMNHRLNGKQMMQEFLCQLLQLSGLLSSSMEIPDQNFQVQRPNKQQRWEVQSITVDVRDRFNSLLLHLVVGHGRDPQHHLLRTYIQSEVQARAIEGINRRKSLSQRLRTWAAIGASGALSGVGGGRRGEGREG